MIVAIIKETGEARNFKAVSKERKDQMIRDAKVIQKDNRPEDVDYVQRVLSFEDEPIIQIIGRYYKISECDFVEV